jgi:2-polyprenyl-3-methyl-5-hydroxy-6-metoxy-1,4-benzoquinol methylase
MNNNIAEAFWDDWNWRSRQPAQLGPISLDQKRAVLRWLEAHQVSGAEILEVGCGTGWMCEALLGFGRVTGLDLSRKCLDEARRRMPHADFIVGDVMHLDLPENRYDVICALEVLAHIDDQPGFIAKLARLLKPGGLLMLATQNRPMLERWAKVAPPAPGQIRRWLDQNEVRALLASSFRIQEMFTVTPLAHKLPLRLITAPRVRALIPGLTPWEERRGWGRTIMVLARKDGAAPADMH